MGSFEKDVGSNLNYPVRRRVWNITSRSLTWYIPNLLLSWWGYKTPELKQAWREKISMCTILLLFSVLFLFLGEGLPRILCEIYGPYGEAKVAGSQLAVIHGKVVSFEHSSTKLALFVQKYPGMDISSAFPRYSLLARHPRNKTYPFEALNDCILSPRSADLWLTEALKAPGYKVTNFQLVGCPDPASSSSNLSVDCFSTANHVSQVRSHTLADFSYTPELIEASKGTLVAINGKVYDLNSFLQPQLDEQNKINETRLLFPLDITELLQTSNLAKAVQLTQRKDWVKYQRCLDLLFYKGKLVSPSSFNNRNECPFWVISLLLCLTPIFILFLKLLLSLLAFTGPPRPRGSASCIIFIPCFRETKLDLENCISSVVETNYIDHGKLLLIVCDGTESLDFVLDTLSHQGSGSEPLSYQSVGFGIKAFNSAIVYSGYYYQGSHGVPYVVVAKAGNSSETSLVGIRGKRDSILIVLNFLDGVSSNENPLTPLEVELLKHVENLDLDPVNFSYLFCVNPNIQVDPDSLPILLHHLEGNVDCMAASGQIYSKTVGHFLIDQLYAFRSLFFRHQVMKGLSAINALTYLNGGFIMYRLQQSTGTRCLTHEDLIFRFANKRTNTLHTKHLVLLGEEEYLTTLLLQFWPRFCLSYIPEARALGPGFVSFSSLFQKECVNFSVRFHSLVDLWLSSAIWGMKLVTFIWFSIELTYSFLMPVLTGYLYFQLFVGFLSFGFPYFWIPISLAGLILICLIYSLSYLRLDVILGLFYYLVWGGPFYHIIIPICSFLKMNHFDKYQLQHHSDDRNSTHSTVDRSTIHHLHSGFLPAPVGFQSLYTELNSLGVPIKMPSSEENNPIHSINLAYLQNGEDSLNYPKLPAFAYTHQSPGTEISATPEALNIINNNRQSLSQLSGNSNDFNRIDSWKNEILQLHNNII